MSKQEELSKTAFGVGVGISVLLFGLVFLWTLGAPDFQEEDSSKIRAGDEVFSAMPEGTPEQSRSNRFKSAVE